VKEIRTNRYDPSSGTLGFSPSQVTALERISRRWEKLGVEL
jgi:hypothetical protein